MTEEVLKQGRELKERIDNINYKIKSIDGYLSSNNTQLLIGNANYHGITVYAEDVPVGTYSAVLALVRSQLIFKRDELQKQLEAL